MTAFLGRREFITLLGGVAAAPPLAAHAQQPAMPVIGLLGGETSETDAFRLNAFRQGLSETGYVEGRNVAFAYRWAEGHYDRLPTLATELVRSRVAVIVALGALPSALAAKDASATIPIVFVIGADPVKVGLVANLNRPGANVTGVTNLSAMIVEKRFEMLKETVPKAGLIGFLVNPASSDIASTTKDAHSAALASGRKLLLWGQAWRARLRLPLQHSSNNGPARYLSQPMCFSAAGLIKLSRFRFVISFRYSARGVNAQLPAVS